MAKVGYIFKENNDSFDAEREWMQRYGCVQIVEETVEHETLRPMWKQLMANLQRGDEIVISKFSNAARGLRDWPRSSNYAVSKLYVSYPFMTELILAVNYSPVRQQPMCCG